MKYEKDCVMQSFYIEVFEDRKKLFSKSFLQNPRLNL